MRSSSYILVFELANSYKSSGYKRLDFATNETCNLLRSKEISQLKL